MCIPIADYSSCVDITAPDFWQYLKNATTFWNWNFHRMVLRCTWTCTCIYNYMYRTETNRFNLPNVYTYNPFKPVDVLMWEFLNGLKTTSLLFTFMCSLSTMINYISGVEETDRCNLCQSWQCIKVTHTHYIKILTLQCIKLERPSYFFKLFKLKIFLCTGKKVHFRYID